jgi:hypothetical protein
MDRIKRFFKVVPKKHHVEFITALLSIPVLLTVIALNWSSLNANKKPETQKPSEIIISLPAQKNPTAIPTKVACKPGLGQIEILNPEEGSVVSQDPLPITIVYTPGDYCAAVWSYRINNGSWSEFDDKSIAIYNPPAGAIDLELRVKSIVNGQQKTITRSFIYKSTQPTPTTTSAPSVTSSQPLSPTTSL